MRPLDLWPSGRSYGVRLPAHSVPDRIAEFPTSDINEETISVTILAHERDRKGIILVEKTTRINLLPLSIRRNCCTQFPTEIEMGNGIQRIS